jgi:hypothetical protein
MARSLWKSWRATGARLVTTGAQSRQLFSLTKDQVVRAQNQHGRATSAPAFPQVWELRNERDCEKLQRSVGLARQNPEPPYYGYWV